MIITVPSSIIELNKDSFADLIPITVTTLTKNEDGSYAIEFASDLTLRQEWLVKIRCSVGDQPVLEQLMISLIDSYTELRQIANSTGTLTSANLSSAVRALARADIRQMRILFGDTDTPAE